MLIEALKAISPVVILADVTLAEAERWLKINNIPYDNLVAKDPTDETSDAKSYRKWQVKYERSRGRTEFFVDSDPELIAWAIEEGIPSLLFVHPQFAAPISRRDSNKGRMSWTEIEAEVNRRQKIAVEAQGGGDDAGL